MKLEPTGLPVPWTVLFLPLTVLAVTATAKITTSTPGHVGEKGAGHVNRTPKLGRISGRAAISRYSKSSFWRYVAAACQEMWRKTATVMQDDVLAGVPVRLRGAYCDKASRSTT